MCLYVGSESLFPHILSGNLQLKYFEVDDYNNSKLMAKMTHARKYHSNIMLVGGGNNFVITH